MNGADKRFLRTQSLVKFEELTMKTYHGERTLVSRAFLGSIVFGLAGFAAQARAQSAVTLPVNPPAALTAPSTQNAKAGADEKLRKHVQEALHTDPYFYDEHVTVSVEKGAVVLRGFVTSDWDLRNAIRIANKAAGDRRVVDNLSIKLGGSR
jgi:osmotically-inducible protein OsmY